MEDSHKRISQAQFDIWIDNPVTLMYIQCLRWSEDQIQEALGHGGFIDSNNNDKTCNQIHSALGEQRGYLKAQNPISFFVNHQMIEAPEEKEKE